MRFEDFARLHGLRVDSLIPGRWVAVPTDDHPRKRNGRYRWLGDVGWVQNWATMQEPAMWRSEERDYQSPQVRRAVADAGRERLELAKKAASKAGWILHQCKTDIHPYLEKKGFPDESGNVWTTEEGQRLLVVPMRAGSRLIGAQLIDCEGNKKFLYGQQTKGASFTMDAKGAPILCEGYATALSIRAVMKAMKVRYTIHVCFSAGNMKDVARGISGGIVVADNDPNGVGEKAARETGKPYWLSDAVGEDFNDFHRRVGLFKAMSSLKRAVFAGGSPAASSAGISPQSGAPVLA
jgi:putative DNA primase/helicase